YVANFIYDGDAPLAERRAQALSVDQAQLRELLGEAELRELLDRQSIEEHERFLQRVDQPIKSADALHDRLLQLGELEIRGHHTDFGNEYGVPEFLEQLLRERRAVAIGGDRYIAAEDAARYRDALGVTLPEGLPAAFLEKIADPLGDLVSRWARTHGPFRAADLTARWGVDVRPALERL